MQDRKYRLRNWAQYNQSLIKRGSITLWMDESAIKNWLSFSATGKSGRPETYSDEAILMLLVLRERWNLTLRTLVGFVASLFEKMGIALPVPSYSQISRRAQTLHKKIEQLTRKGVQHIIFDSTGLKVYGEGEWKVKIHGKGKRRTWRKFHVGIDAETQEIITCELTSNSEGDAATANKMLKRIPGRLKSIRGDGAYDASELRKTGHLKGAKMIVPPPKNATYKGSTDGWERERDASLAEIEGLGGGQEGRKLWKKLIGYHKRSLVETTIFRVKRMLGERLKARSSGAQRTEVICKCLVINKMNKIGLPKGQWVLKAA